MADSNKQMLNNIENFIIRICAEDPDRLTGCRKLFSLRRHYPVQVLRVSSQPPLWKHPGNSVGFKKEQVVKLTSNC